MFHRSTYLITFNAAKRIHLFLVLLICSLPLTQSPAALAANAQAEVLPHQQIDLKASNVSKSPLDTQLQSLLEQQRSLGCDDMQNTLQSVLCSGEFRIGVRHTFKGFGMTVGNTLVGYEIDFANYIANELGVRPILVPVTVPTRTRALINGEIDLSLATITHTKEREETVYFIRPHYYTSSTTVAGLRSRNISSLSDMKDVTLCAPQGAYTNTTFAKARAKILLFTNPEKMFDSLRFGACDLVTHDKALILLSISGPMAPRFMTAVFEEKFSFGEAPWGMAIRLADGDAPLAKALSLISAHAHERGMLEQFATKHGVQLPFLYEQRKIWSNPHCFLLGGQLSPTCLETAPWYGDSPSVLAPLAKHVEGWLNKTFDINILLPMFSGKESLRLMARSTVISILLVAGVILATVLFGIAFYVASNSRWPVIRVPSNILRLILMNSPAILLLVFAYLIISGVWLYTGILAIVTAILAIGLNNGAAAGESLVQASKTLATDASFLDVARVSATPYRACVINAAKAAPLAAFIGTPEILSMLTDSTAYVGDISVTLTILLLFYIIVVQSVVGLSASAVGWLNTKAPEGDRV